MNRNRLLVALAACALLVAGCTPGTEPDAKGAVTAEVRVPDQPPAATHGNDPLPPRPQGLVAQLAPEAAWPCEGTGADGRRVQMVYAHTGTGNLAANRPTFEGITRRIEGTFLSSARRGGGERLVRFVTGPECGLSIVDAVVSADAIASFDQLIVELSAMGLNRRDRVYHAWVEGSSYCGIGTVYSDDSPIGNLNERYAQYSRSDRQCWNYAEAHEITHNLGGVQNSAPNSTGGLHSRDEYDVMSYADGAPRGQMIQPYPCPNVADEDRLDCGEDDYYSASPNPGGYLASHWNVASSSALARSAGTTTVPPPTTTTSTTVPPTTTTTTTTTTGQGRTTTNLVVPRGIRAGQQATFTVTVTGDCRPGGVVEIRASGRLKSAPVLADGTATAVLTFAEPGRFTVRADYVGSPACAPSRDTARPRVGT